MKMKKIKVVLVSAWPPTRFHAGGQRQIDLYKYLKSTGKYELALYARDIAAISNQIDLELLSGVFDEIYWSKGNVLSGTELSLMSNDNHFDVVDLQHLESTIEIDSFRRLGNRIIYTPMESEIRNFVIKLRQGRITKALMKLMFREIQAVRKTDATVAVSLLDSRFLRLASPTKINKIDTPIPSEFVDFLEENKSLDFAERKGVIFVAYFGSQTNIDAVDWYVSNVHREVRKQIPEIIFYVVGDKSEVLNGRYPNMNVEILGRVDNVAPYIFKSRIAIAPALYGSGFRGKVNQYSILSIPTVAHSLAVTSLNYPKNAIMICDSPQEWIYSIIDLYVHEERCLSVANLAREHAFSFTLQHQRETIDSIYYVK